MIARHRFKSEKPFLTWPRRQRVSFPDWLPTKKFWSGTFAGTEPRKATVKFAPARNTSGRAWLWPEIRKETVLIDSLMTRMRALFYYVLSRARGDTPRNLSKILGFVAADLNGGVRCSPTEPRGAVLLSDVPASKLLVSHWSPHHHGYNPLPPATGPQSFPRTIRIDLT